MRLPSRAVRERLSRLADSRPLPLRLRTVRVPTRTIYAATAFTSVTDAVVRKQVPPTLWRFSLTYSTLLIFFKFIFQLNIFCVNDVGEYSCAPQPTNTKVHSYFM